MKRFALLFLCILLLTSCGRAPAAPVKMPEQTAEPTVCVPETAPTEVFTEPETETTLPQPQLELTEEEKNMLLKIGMAERGEAGCTQCIALVMRTVLNRVEAERFGSSIRSVIFAPEQFTPVMDGSYDAAEPNQQCREALEQVICGWDESQGALFYEWCEGESWHSKNLQLLFQHCDVRFYR